MTNSPSTRKTHVIRILGTDKSGSVLQDMWVDVERIDVVKSKTQTRSGGWQGHQRKHKWQDDPNSNDYQPDGNPARKIKIVKVCSPHSINVNDPDEWVPIPVIQSMKSIGYDGSLNSGTQSRFRTGLNNDVSPTTRVVEARKISHYKTNIDAAAQAAFRADPTLRAYVVPGEVYQRDDSTKDDNQFVDHEVVKFIKHRFNPNDVKSGSVNTGLQMKMLNQYLIDESDAADGAVIGATGINPPYRLDPWQNIVNVQLKPIYLVVTLGATNRSLSTGPYGPSPSVGTPTISAEGVKEKGAILLDTYTPADSNSSTDGSIQCMVWFPVDGSVTAEMAYGDGPFHGYGLTTCTNGVCDTTGIGVDEAAPIDFQKSIAVAKRWLFRVAPVDGSVTIDIGGLIADTDTGPNHPSNNQVTTNGAGSISVSVWSTARGAIKTIDQLVDIHGDGKPRPTEDDQITAGVNSSTQGKLLVNVELDKNKSDVQTDNWGNKYRPYKVTLTPDDGAVDHVPDQPPPHLPN